MGKTLQVVKDADQDYEWYPTTDRMLAKIVKHYGSLESYQRGGANQSVLDVGAGDGRVLKYFSDNGLSNQSYAIEKSDVLRAAMDSSVFVIGTDFYQQSLWDKNVNILFCNPPYSQYAEWVSKIIRESVAIHVYLIIPKRWRSNQAIKDALRDRGKKIEAVTIATSNFNDAERQARAEVEIVYIHNYRHQDSEDDPFNIFFDQQFKNIADKFDEDILPEREDEDEDIETGIVNGRNLIERLVINYQKEQDEIISAYNKIGDIDRIILKELEITKANLMNMLRERVINLKKKYWKLLFDHMDSLTSRLTSKTRTHLMSKLNSETAVDFTVSNAYSIVIWAIKQVNKYVDQQLIDVYESLVGTDSAYGYKSNEKVFVSNRWRYLHYSGREEDAATHFYLDYRIVSERSGGLATGEYIYGRELKINLSDRAFDSISDILTVANNLGFTAKNDIDQREWGSKAEFFYMKDDREMLKVRAYKNQNLHLNFLPELMMALNVEYGRLRGWISSPQEAAEALSDPKALEMFGTNLQLGRGSVPLLESGE